MTEKRQRSARHSADKGQRIAREEAAAKAAAAQSQAATMALTESSAASCYSLDDLPEWCDPRVNPTEIEKVAHLFVMQHVGEDTFDETGKRVTGRALIPTRSADSDSWQEFNDAYTTENLETHNHIAEARRIYMEDAAEPRRAVRKAKRAEMLAKLKGTTAQ